jgi:Rod binding domain-containing protein
MDVKSLLGTDSTALLNVKDEQRLKKACKQFESVLVGQMLKQMRESVPKTDLFGSDEKESMFRGMLDDEIAMNASNSGAFGLADVIYSQLAPKNLAKVPAAGVDTSVGKKAAEAAPISQGEK